MRDTLSSVIVTRQPKFSPKEADQRGRAGGRAVEHILPYTPRLCLHGDTDFSLTKHFDRWAEVADVIFGMDCSAAAHGSDGS